MVIKDTVMLLCVAGHVSRSGLLIHSSQQSPHRIHMQVGRARWQSMCWGMQAKHLGVERNVLGFPGLLAEPAAQLLASVLQTAGCLLQLLLLLVLAVLRNRAACTCQAFTLAVGHASILNRRKASDQCRSTGIGMMLHPQYDLRYKPLNNK